MHDTEQEAKPVTQESAVPSGKSRWGPEPLVSHWRPVPIATSEHREPTWGRRPTLPTLGLVQTAPQAGSWHCLAQGQAACSPGSHFGPRGSTRRWGQVGDEVVLP